MLQRVEKSIKEEVGAVSPSKVIKKEGNPESEVASASLSGSGDKKDNTIVELPVPLIPVSNVLGTLVPEQVTDTDNNKSNEMPTVEPTEELTQKKSAEVSVDKQAEDEPIVVNAPEASIEATEKLEQTKRTPVSKISEPEPEPIIKIVNKSQEESVVVEQVEKEEKNKPDETPTTEPSEEHKQEEPAGQSVNKQALEQPIVVDASVASIEAKEKLEVQSKSTTVSEIPEPVLEANNKSQKESVVMEQVEKSDKQKERGVEQSSVVGFSGAMEKPEKQSVSEIPEPLHKVVNNPREQSLVTKQFEEDSVKVELNELVEDGAVMKDTSSEEHTSKDEEPEPQKQIPEVEGEQADKGSERVELLESAVGETTKNEGILSIQTKETPVSNEDQISEGEQPNPSEIVHQVSKDIEISALTEELIGSVVDKVENLISSVSTKDAARNPAGMDSSRRDLTLVTEDKPEETPTLIETSKVGDVGETLVEVSESDINVEAKESPGKELQEAKGEETVKAGPGKLEKEKEVKDDDGSQTSQNPAKEQAPPKPIQRNILSKVKQSLAKAKRVITGKSPSSKVPSSDSKGENDIKVK